MNRKRKYTNSEKTKWGTDSCKKRNQPYSEKGRRQPVRLKVGHSSIFLHSYFKI